MIWKNHNFFKKKLKKLKKNYRKLEKIKNKKKLEKIREIWKFNKAFETLKRNLNS